MEHFHYRNIGQIGHFFMNFHYARYKKVKKSVPPKLKNEASDHLNWIISWLLDGRETTEEQITSKAILQSKNRTKNESTSDEKDLESQRFPIPN